MYIEGLITDITEHKYFESLILQERSMLEHIAANSSLPELLTNLTNTHESLFPRTMCSVLLLDASGKYLTHGAAPSLPDAYLNDINGIAIGPSVGSCGTAAYTGEIVIVSDIETDPLWSNYRQFASKHNLRACWSVPIKSAEGAVLGTFALYYHEPRSPLQHELTAIISSARLAGIAIERKRAEETLRRTQKEYEALLNTIDGIVWEADARNFQYSYVSKQTERLLGYPAAKWLDEPTFWKDHIYSEDQNWAVNYRVDCTRKLEDHEFEYRMITADGSIVWLRDIVSVIVEKDQPVTLR
jgi:PAS domain S-box-containing protein